MTTIMPAPAYILARAAWVTPLVLRHADDRFTRLEGEACADYAAARAHSGQSLARTVAWSHERRHVLTGSRPRV